MSTNRNLPRTPLALVVLALLKEQPMHPYQMRVRMRERGHEHIVRLKGASLYDWDAMLSTDDVVEVPPIFIIEADYAQAMRRAELDWVRGLIHRLEGEDLWPDAETLNRIGEVERQRLEEAEETR